MENNENNYSQSFKKELDIDNYKIEKFWSAKILNNFYEIENCLNESKILNNINIEFLKINIFGQNLRKISLLCKTDLYDKNFYNIFKENYNKNISSLIFIKTKNSKKFGFYISSKNNSKIYEFEDCLFSLEINKKFEFLKSEKLKIEFISDSTGKFHVNFGDVNLFNFSFFFSYILEKNNPIFKDDFCEKLMINDESSYFVIKEIEIYTIEY